MSMKDDQGGLQGSPCVQAQRLIQAGSLLPERTPMKGRLGAQVALHAAFPVIDRKQVRSLSGEGGGFAKPHGEDGASSQNGRTSVVLRPVDGDALAFER